MKKILSRFIIIIILLAGGCYFVFVYGWLEFRKNTDTPEEFLSRVSIPADEYRRDEFELTRRFRGLADSHSGFFYSKAYFEGIEIIIDTILYSPDYRKLAALVITKNPTSRQLIPDKNSDWYYNATVYLAVRERDSIELSWFGPSFTNSIDLSGVSQIIRDHCFREFASKSTNTPNERNYNFNDIRFWTSSVWQKFEEKERERVEYEREKEEHPENIVQPD